ncbi:hypothetical protein GQ44DRAFT_707835, partial [Phaeosphaeriaceae sp. PMI808]
MAFGILTANASAHKSVHETEMPGVHKMVGLCHTLMAFYASLALFYLHNLVFIHRLCLVGFILLCPMSRPASLIIFVIVIA